MLRSWAINIVQIQKEVYFYSNKEKNPKPYSLIKIRLAYRLNFYTVI